MQPTLETARLLLRPLRLADAPRIEHLAGEREIAANTLLIPHPYPAGAGAAWIVTLEDDYERGKSACFAVVEQKSNELVGSMGLTFTRQHQRAELGYWIGKPYWNRGYCSEAAAELLRWGFETLDLHRIQAHHFTRNPASGRVLAKIGMQPEGVSRGYVLKWGEYLDVAWYGALNPRSQQ